MSQFLDLQYRQDDLARHRENRGRMANVSATALTTGPGTAELPDAIDFNGAIFIERPAFAYGSEVDPDAIRDLLGLGPNDSIELPHTSGHIASWDVDENGCYVGAWVAITVTYPYSILITYPVEVTHHLQFFGVALKDVDPNG